MKQRATTALLLIGVLGLMVVVGPALDAEPDYAQQVAHEEAIKHFQRVRFERAAREVCGGSAWALTQGKNEIVCKRGARKS